MRVVLQTDHSTPVECVAWCVPQSLFWMRHALHPLHANGPTSSATTRHICTQLKPGLQLHATCLVCFADEPGLTCVCAPLDAPHQSDTCVRSPVRSLHLGFDATHQGVSTLSDAWSFYGLTSNIPPLGSTLNFDADVKKTTTPHQCENCS